MSERQQLIDMGFEPDRVDWALHVTQNRGMQPALDHVVEHSERPIPDYKSAAAPVVSGDDGEEYDAEDQAALAAMYAKKGQQGEDDMLASIGEAKSVKCSDCGKLLRSAAFASFHAEKSGHTNFEESTEEVKALTEDEKKQKLQELREKLALKRAAQSKEDAVAQRENEKIRRKAGQDMGAAREELKRKELLQEAERKRREKASDLEAKKRVREQIEADKRERANKAARDKALREGQTVEATPAAQTKPTAPTAPTSSSTEARLRVRAPQGMWMGTMPAESTLLDVEAKMQGEGKASGSLNFSTTFPRKVFTSEEKRKTLRDLGLVPNAALEASQAA